MAQSKLKTMNEQERLANAYVEKMRGTPKDRRIAYADGYSDGYTAAKKEDAVGKWTDKETQFNIEDIINKAIDDFSRKWDSHDARSLGVSKYAAEIIDVLEQSPPPAEPLDEGKWTRAKLLDLIEFTRNAGAGYGITKILDQFKEIHP